MKDNIQLSEVEDHDGILTIRGGGARRDWNGMAASLTRTFMSASK